MQHIQFMSSVGGIAFTVAMLAALIMPQPTHAATFAYVSFSGIVKSLEASSAAAALLSALDISTHSGVLLINDTPDATVVGDQVTGIK